MKHLLFQNRVRLQLILILALSLCALVLLAVPFKQSTGSAQGIARRDRQAPREMKLDAQRRLALKGLSARLRAGDPFAREEIELLKRFNAGETLTEGEADTLISRALYNRYILAAPQTKEQEQLLDLYSSLISRREHDIADLKFVNQEAAFRAAETGTNQSAPNAPTVAPANDLCAGAEVIPGAGPFPYSTAVTADITDATLTGDPPLPSCQTDVSRSIWYTFTPTTTAAYTISSCANAPTGSTVDDTIIAVYTSAGACAGAFTEIATAGLSDGCDDDSCTTETLQAFISTQLVSGTQYFVVVWEFDPTAPTVGNTAVQLRISQTPAPGNDLCTGATALTLDTPVSGTTIGANVDYTLTGATCFNGVGHVSSTAPGRDVAYSFTAPSAGRYSFKVNNYNTSNNLVTYVTTSCSAPGAIACDNVAAIGAANRSTASLAEEVNCLSLTNGQQVFAFVDENAATAGSTFTIEVNRCTLETEPNATPATASGIPFGIEGSLTPAGDVDFYGLGGLIPAGSRVFAMLDGNGSNSTDFDMRVTTATDTLEYDDINNDVLFGSLSPCIAGTPLTGGLSYLRVDHFSGTASEPYRLYATVQPPGTGLGGSSATAETEVNNTIAQANSATNNFFSGSLAGPAPSTDLDVFSFTATAGNLIFLSLDADPLRDGTPINGRLELLDNAGVALVVVNDGGSTSSTTSGAGSLTATTPNSPAEGIIWRAVYTGTYYARVTIGTTSVTGTGAGDYLLSISRNGQIGPSANGASLSGRVTDGNGVPVSGAVINMSGTQSRKTITDADGSYRFNDVETGGFYTVTPARANYNFSPSSRSLSLVGNRTDAIFTGMSTGDNENPLDTAEFFVRQQYVDILNRQPDEAGFNYWSDQILGCGDDLNCALSRRNAVAAAFFIEQEAQLTGSFIYDVYSGALGRRPRYAEYRADRGQVVGGAALDTAKTAYARDFVQRSEFVSKYENALTAETLVDALLENVQSQGLDLGSERGHLIGVYHQGSDVVASRAAVIRSLADHAAFKQSQYNRAFVLTEYFAYLQRDIDQRGYDFWVGVLDRDSGNYLGMVCSFVTSREYQLRFSSVVSHSNGECAQ